MITSKELTKLETIQDDWKWRDLTEEEQNYVDNFPHIFAQAIQCDFEPETQFRIAAHLYNGMLKNEYYIVAKEDDNETKYLTFDEEFTDDINKAAFCVDETTAFFLIDGYKETIYWNNEITKEEWDDHSYDFGLKIVPVKKVVSYERV